jgi:hypothetical protein
MALVTTVATSPLLQLVRPGLPRAKGAEPAA